MEFSQGIGAGALSGGLGGAGALSFLGPPGMLIGGGLGAIAGGFSGWQSEQAQKNLAHQIAEDRRRRELLAASLRQQGQEGSMAMMQAGRQRIQQGYEGQSQGVVRDAARRGLVHSGAHASMGRVLSRRREDAETQLSGAAQQYLTDALSQAANLEYGGGDYGRMLQQYQAGGNPWGEAIGAIGQMGQAYAGREQQQQYNQMLQQALGRGGSFAPGFGDAYRQWGGRMPSPGYVNPGVR